MDVRHVSFLVSFALLGCSSSNVTVAPPVDDDAGLDAIATGDSTSAGDSTTTSDGSADDSSSQQDSSTSSDSSSPSNDTGAAGDSIVSSSDTGADAPRADGGKDAVSVEIGLPDAGSCSLAPRAGCCFSDHECAKSSKCYRAFCTASGEGRCEAQPDPGKCWADSDCPVGSQCVGEQICPCGSDCFIADSPGSCSAPG